MNPSELYNPCETCILLVKCIQRYNKTIKYWMDNNIRNGDMEHNAAHSNLVSDCSILYKYTHVDNYRMQLETMNYSYSYWKKLSYKTL